MYIGIIIIIVFFGFGFIGVGVFGFIFASLRITLPFGFCDFFIEK